MNLTCDSIQMRLQGRPQLRPWMLGASLAFSLFASIAPAEALEADRIPAVASSIDGRFGGSTPLLERPLDGFSAEGARVVAWDTRGAIEKISVEGLGERGRVSMDFYWRRGKLVAAHAQRVDYGANITELPKGTPAPATVVEDQWLEFSGDRLVRMREGDRELPAGDVSSRRRAAELEASARSFRRLVQTPPARGTAAGSCTWSCSAERGDECFRYVCR